MKSPRIFILAGLTAWMAIACSPASFTQNPAAAQNYPASCSSGATCSTTGNVISVDRVIQVPATAKKVDVLVVNDNSRSMQQEQASMGSRMSNFIQALNANGLDWQIGIVTTDMSGSGAKQGGNLVPFSGTNGQTVITNSTPNAVSDFMATIQMTIDTDPSTWGSGWSRGIYAALAAIRNNQNGWMRSDAALAVIIMSNEDEMKNGGQYYGYPMVSGDDYPSDLIAAAGSKSLSVHSIIVKPGDSSCLTAQQKCTTVGTCGDGSYGNYYAQLSAMTGGVVGNVCASDYGSQLSQIGGSIVSQTLASYQLDCSPVANSLQILGTTPSNLQFSTAVNGNQLDFTPALPAGTSVHITYQCQVN